jgi:putative phosphoesterase
MKIGLISDAHGNPIGLKNCLEFFQKHGVERIFFLGDAVGYLPHWNEVLSLLSAYDVVCLRGNHDDMVLTQRVSDKKNDVYRLFPEYIETIHAWLDWMRTWPDRINLRLCGRNILLIHGSPIAPLTGYVYPWSDLSIFERVEADAIVMGHTHRPFIADIGGKKIINVGSCGLPRDVGNLSSCGIIDVEEWECQIFRLPFDAAKIAQSSDGAHESVLQCLLRTGEGFGKMVG